MPSSGAPDPWSWAQVDEVLEAVAESRPDEREALLDSLCKGNPHLRAEVESLLPHVSPSEVLLADLSVTLGGRGGGPRADEESVGTDGYLGSYRLIRELAGGMSQVFEAWDDKQKRRVVIKLARHDRDAMARERLSREARADASLQHPSICRILDVGSTPEDRPFIVLEYCEGESLSERRKRGPLELPLIVSIGQQIADGLSEAHGLGIIHRDVKPENVMVDGDGRVKLLDFGSAQEGLERLTNPGMVVGTPLYMSPEQLRGDSVTAATDIWSLGVLLHELISEEHPFRGGSRRRTLMNIVHRPAPPLADQGWPGAETLPAIVGAALSPDPAQRPSASALAGELSGVLAAL